MEGSTGDCKFINGMTDYRVYSNVRVIVCVCESVRLDCHVLCYSIENP